MLNWISWFFFHPGSSSCTPGWSRTHRSALLCFRSAGTKGKRHHQSELSLFFFKTYVSKVFSCQKQHLVVGCGSTFCDGQWILMSMILSQPVIPPGLDASYLCGPREHCWTQCHMGALEQVFPMKRFIQWKFLTSSHPGKRWNPNRFPSTSGRQSMSLRQISYSLEFRALRQNFSLHFLKQKPQIKGK